MMVQPALATEASPRGRFEPERRGRTRFLPGSSRLAGRPGDPKRGQGRVLVELVIAIYGTSLAVIGAGLVLVFAMSLVAI